MASRIAAIAIDAHDPRRVAEFWAAALGWEVWSEEEEGITIAPPGSGEPSGAGGPSIDVLRVPDGKTVKNRLHLDLRADSTSQLAEVERLVDLGATRIDIGQGPDVTWVVLADPEGNEFCVLQRSVQEVEATKTS